MIVAGIDLGKKGYIATYCTESRQLLTTTKLPLDHNEELDAHQLFTFLLSNEVAAVVMEQVFKPNSLVRLGGEVLGVCKVLQLDVIEKVAVVTWKKAVLGCNTNDKALSISKCEELFPKLNLSPPTKTGRVSKSKDDNIAEAALLAKWLADRLTPGD